MNRVDWKEEREVAGQAKGSSTWMQRCWDGTHTLTVQSLEDDTMCLASLCSARMSPTCSVPV
jgi:hypothetical protein